MITSHGCYWCGFRVPATTGGGCCRLAPARGIQLLGCVIQPAGSLQSGAGPAPQPQRELHAHSSDSPQRPRAGLGTPAHPRPFPSHATRAHPHAWLHPPLKPPSCLAGSIKLLIGRGRGGVAGRFSVRGGFFFLSNFMADYTRPSAANSVHVIAEHLKCTQQPVTPAATVAPSFPRCLKRSA